ncbi:Hpt domain-containing protein, partial [Teichococcus deserti]|uniref:Hpt domain-containing protein n=1 Tax=Teichococcus deserti TaxID=1817963 RepID=UPI001F60A951
MTDFRQELLAAFGIEHQEHLGAIRAALAAAGRGQEFDLRDVFRRAHSLKGAARAVDLPVVEELAHRLEAVFTAVGEGGLALDAPAIAAIQLGLDGVEGYVAALAGTPEPAAPEAARRALEGLLSAPVPEAPPRPAPEPAAAAPEPPPAAETGPAIEYLRIPAGQVEALAGAVHALSDSLGRQAGLEAGLRGLEAAMRGLRRDFDGFSRAAVPGAARSETFGRELDRMARELGQLTRAQREAAWTAEAAAAQLRLEAGRISLVPAETVLGSLGRMARDLARDSGQPVAVRLEGLALQADRRVLQALKDPVTHLLRNAVSHGLDSPAERARRGKPEQAEIALSLEARGGLLVLRVADDGRGPDLARIEAVAVQRGLLPARDSATPPPPAEQLLSLVFESGFSTAEAVDRLSGRGIGLSV